MTEVSVSEAKKELDQIMERAHQGEEIIITEGGVRLVELKSVRTGHQNHRSGGIWKDRIRMSDDFDEPLTDLESEIYRDRT